jgi:Sortase domain
MALAGLICLIGLFGCAPSAEEVLRGSGAAGPGHGGHQAEHQGADQHGHGPDDPVTGPSDPVVREPLPVTVEIPAIRVDAELVGLGLARDGAMEVPDFGLAGWYTEGPPPGAPGPAVIAAHVDSRDGPDVFYELYRLQPGDAVDVHRADGSTASFVVVTIEQHPKDELPVDRIWAASTGAELTLITCGGVFDRAAGHYADNVIVYTTAAP